MNSGERGFSRFQRSLWCASKETAPPRSGSRGRGADPERRRSASSNAYHCGSPSPRRGSRPRGSAERPARCARPPEIGSFFGATIFNGAMPIGDAAQVRVRQAVHGEALRVAPNPVHREREPAHRCPYSAIHISMIDAQIPTAADTATPATRSAGSGLPPKTSQSTSMQADMAAAPSRVRFKNAIDTGS